MDVWLKREKLNCAIVDGRINESLYKLELEELQESWFRKIHNIPKECRMP